MKDKSKSSKVKTMAAMSRSRSLGDKESLYGDDGDQLFIGDEDWTSEELDLDSDGTRGRGVRSSVSLLIYGRQRDVHFSNREYYRRLEQLKNTHLRNMADLERMYISQGREEEEQREEEGEEGGVVRGRRRGTRLSVSSCPARTLQRINSQEELDLHETTSGSDQSELCGEDGAGEPELDHRRSFAREILLSPEELTTGEQFRFQPAALGLNPRGRLSCRPGVRARSSSKVTVPKPFQMMLREEERKRRKVPTRSEVELENTLLKRELEELRECTKTFRASPAPAHIHLPLYDIISRRPGQRRSYSCNHDSGVYQDFAAISPEPFHFLERERKKREAKIVAELGNVGQKEERRAFRARPVPGSVYGTKHRAGSETSKRTQQREATEGHPESIRSRSDSLRACGPQRGPSSRRDQKHMERVDLTSTP